MADPESTSKRASPPPITKRVLGHDFRPMSEHFDHEAFAGADPGSWIAYLDDVVLILLPDGRELCAIDNDGNETVWRVVR